LVQQGLADRGLHGEPAARAVGLPGADEGPRLHLTRTLVADLGRATERKRQYGPLGRINHDGTPQPLPQTEDPRLHVRLVLFGGVVLAVLLEVAVAAGGADPRRDVPAPNRLEFRELRLDSRQARLGDRLSVVLGDVHLSILAHRATGGTASPTGTFRARRCTQRWEYGAVRAVNVASCELDDVLERGEFRHAAFHLTEPLGASVIGASVYEMRAGEKCWPYHYHHGVEEWLYVVSGAPILRDPGGGRTLEPGTLVAFASGPPGAHAVHGPGRIVIFSTGARGWGEAFVTVYPDSDKIGAAPGVRFRRGDALRSWAEDAGEPLQPLRTESRPESAQATGLVELPSVLVDRSASDGSPVQSATLGPLLGARTWAATLHHLAPGGASSPYHYQWCREEWALVLSGAPTLRHPGGEDALNPGDIVCFPQGPTGAHRIMNGGEGAARLVVFSTPVGRPVSVFYPDDGTVLIRVPGYEAFLFRQADQIEDYWDGEPGAGMA
jgi:uncharacterized cupin superfamily protein